LNRKFTLWLGVLLFLIALSARLIPLQFSTLPYNLDGFPLAKISEVIVDTGTLPIASEHGYLIGYNMKMPVFSVMLSSFSLVLGVEPLDLLPYFTALIGSLAVVFLYIWSLNLTRNRLVAFSTGLFAALTGLFVYATTAAMKQLLAIVLLTFLIFLYQKRRDWRYLTVMILVLLLMPFTHHLTTLMTLLILSFALAGSAFKFSEKHQPGHLKHLIIDLLSGPLILLISLSYYRLVNLEFVSEVANVNDIVLLSSVIILMAVVARMLSETVQTKPWFFLNRGEEREVGLSCIFDEKVLVLIIGIGTLYLNSKIDLFVGGTMTSDLLLRLMLPYLVLAVIATMGFNVIRYTRFPNRYIVVAMFLAPITVMVFALLHGLDIFGFTLVYRSYNFMDIPLALAVGVGFVYIFTRIRDYSRRNRDFWILPYGAVVIFALLCAASLPLAYSNEAAFGIQEVTHEFEFEAMEWASSAGIGYVITDQRYSDIVNPYYGIDTDWTGPWRMKGGQMNEGNVTFLSRYWTDGGAQMSTLGRVTFDKDWMNDFLDNSNVIYIGGPSDREVVIAIVR